MTNAHEPKRSVTFAPTLAPCPTDVVLPVQPLDTIAVRISVAARISGIGRTKLYELIKDGHIEAFKVGTATLVPVESLRGFLNGLRRKQPSSDSLSRSDS